MDDLQNVAKKIGAEFEKMINAGKMPAFELQYEKNGEREWCLVVLSMHTDGIHFGIPDANIVPRFSGNIVKLTELWYLLPFDEYFDNLDYYLQEIYQEMVENYFLKNGFEILS